MDRIAQILASQRPQGVIGLPHLQTVSDPSYAPMQDTAATQPFVWGQGGQRLSMDDIERQRELAAQQLQAGSDYSPVASPWQGLARVSQAVVGALGEKRADKDAQVYQAQQAGDLAAAGVSPQIAQLLLSKNTSGVGEAAYKATLPKTPQLTDYQQMLIAGGIQPGSPEWQKRNLDRATALSDPFVTAQLPGNRFYSGPQSQFNAALGGGDPSLAGATPAPDVLPPDFDFGGQTPPASGNF